MITAENTYTKEYLAANHNYLKTLQIHKNYKRSLIIKSMLDTFLLIWVLSSFSMRSVFTIITCIAAICFAANIISDIIKLWTSFISKKRFIPDSFHRRFIFDSDTFGLVSHSDNYSAERYKRYPSMHMAAEWEDWFFVYFTPGEVCIIKKSDIIDGSPDELRELLKEKLGNRFVQKGTAT